LVCWFTLPGHILRLRLHTTPHHHGLHTHTRLRLRSHGCLPDCCVLRSFYVYGWLDYGFTRLRVYGWLVVYVGWLVTVTGWLVVVWFTFALLTPRLRYGYVPVTRYGRLRLVGSYVRLRCWFTLLHDSRCVRSHYTRLVDLRLLPLFHIYTFVYGWFTLRYGWLRLRYGCCVWFTVPLPHVYTRWFTVVRYVGAVTHIYVVVHGCPVHMVLTHGYLVGSRFGSAVGHGCTRLRCYVPVGRCVYPVRFVWFTFVYGWLRLVSFGSGLLLIYPFPFGLRLVTRLRWLTFPTLTHRFTVVTVDVGRLLIPHGLRLVVHTVVGFTILPRFTVAVRLDVGYGYGWLRCYTRLFTVTHTHTAVGLVGYVYTRLLWFTHVYGYHITVPLRYGYTTRLRSRFRLGYLYGYPGFTLRYGCWWLRSLRCWLHTFALRLRLHVYVCWAVPTDVVGLRLRWLRYTRFTFTVTARWLRVYVTFTFVDYTRLLRLLRWLVWLLVTLHVTGYVYVLRLVTTTFTVTRLPVGWLVVVTRLFTVAPFWLHSFARLHTFGCLRLVTHGCCPICVYGWFGYGYVIYTVTLTVTLHTVWLHVWLVVRLVTVLHLTVTVTFGWLRYGYVYVWFGLRCVYHVGYDGYVGLVYVCRLLRLLVTRLNVWFTVTFTLGCLPTRRTFCWLLDYAFTFYVYVTHVTLRLLIATRLLRLILHTFGYVLLRLLLLRCCYVDLRCTFICCSVTFVYVFTFTLGYVRLRLTFTFTRCYVYVTFNAFTHVAVVGYTRLHTIYILHLAFTLITGSLLILLFTLFPVTLLVTRLRWLFTLHVARCLRFTLRLRLLILLILRLVVVHVVVYVYVDLRWLFRLRLFRLVAALLLLFVTVDLFVVVVTRWILRWLVPGYTFVGYVVRYTFTFVTHVWLLFTVVAGYGWFALLFPLLRVYVYGCSPFWFDLLWLRLRWLHTLIYICVAVGYTFVTLHLRLPHVYSLRSLDYVTFTDFDLRWFTFTLLPLTFTLFVYLVAYTFAFTFAVGCVGYGSVTVTRLVTRLRFGWLRLRLPLRLRLRLRYVTLVYVTLVTVTVVVCRLHVYVCVLSLILFHVSLRFTLFIWVVTLRYVYVCYVWLLVAFTFTFVTFDFTRLRLLRLVVAVVTTHYVARLRYIALRLRCLRYVLVTLLRFGWLRWRLHGHVTHTPHFTRLRSTRLLRLPFTRLRTRTVYTFRFTHFRRSRLRGWISFYGYVALLTVVAFVRVYVTFTFGCGWLRYGYVAGLVTFVHILVHALHVCYVHSLPHTRLIPVVAHVYVAVYPHHARTLPRYVWIYVWFTGDVYTRLVTHTTHVVVTLLVGYVTFTVWFPFPGWFGYTVPFPTVTFTVWVAVHTRLPTFGLRYVCWLRFTFGSHRFAVYVCRLRLRLPVTDLRFYGYVWLRFVWFTFTFYGYGWLLQCGCSVAVTVTLDYVPRYGYVTFTRCSTLGYRLRFVGYGWFPVACGLHHATLVTVTVAVGLHVYVCRLPFAFTLHVVGLVYVYVRLPTFVGYVDFPSFTRLGCCSFTVYTHLPHGCYGFTLHTVYGWFGWLRSTLLRYVGCYVHTRSFVYATVTLLPGYVVTTFALRVTLLHHVRSFPGYVWFTVVTPVVVGCCCWTFYTFVWLRLRFAFGYTFTVAVVYTFDLHVRCHILRLRLHVVVAVVTHGCVRRCSSRLLHARFGCVGYTHLVYFTLRFTVTHVWFTVTVTFTTRFTPHTRLHVWLPGYVTTHVYVYGSLYLRLRCYVYGYTRLFTPFTVTILRLHVTLLHVVTGLFAFVTHHTHVYGLRLRRWLRLRSRLLVTFTFYVTLHWLFTTLVTVGFTGTHTHTTHAFTVPRARGLRFTFTVATLVTFGCGCVVLFYVHAHGLRLVTFLPTVTTFTHRVYVGLRFTHSYTVVTLVVAFRLRLVRFGYVAHGITRLPVTAHGLFTFVTHTLPLVPGLRLLRFTFGCVPVCVYVYHAHVPVTVVYVYAFTLHTRLFTLHLRCVYVCWFTRWVVVYAGSHVYTGLRLRYGYVVTLHVYGCLVCWTTLRGYVWFWLYTQLPTFGFTPVTFGWLRSHVRLRWFGGWLVTFWLIYVGYLYHTFRLHIWLLRCPLLVGCLRLRLLFTPFVLRSRLQFTFDLHTFTLIPGYHVYVYGLFTLRLRLPPHHGLLRIRFGYVWFVTHVGYARCGYGYAYVYVYVCVCVCWLRLRLRYVWFPRLHVVTLFVGYVTVYVYVYVYFVVGCRFTVTFTGLRLIVPFHVVDSRCCSRFCVLRCLRFARLRFGWFTLRCGLPRIYVTYVWFTLRLRLRLQFRLHLLVTPLPFTCGRLRYRLLHTFTFTLPHGYVYRYGYVYVGYTVYHVWFSHARLPRCVFVTLRWLRTVGYVYVYIYTHVSHHHTVTFTRFWFYVWVPVTRCGWLRLRLRYTSLRYIYVPFPICVGFTLRLDGYGCFVVWLRSHTRLRSLRTPVGYTFYGYHGCVLRLPVGYVYVYGSHRVMRFTTPRVVYVGWLHTRLFYGWFVLHTVTVTRLHYTLVTFWFVTRWLRSVRLRLVGLHFTVTVWTVDVPSLVTFPTPTFTFTLIRFGSHTPRLPFTRLRCGYGSGCYGYICGYTVYRLVYVTHTVYTRFTTRYVCWLVTRYTYRLYTFTGWLRLRLHGCTVVPHVCGCYRFTVVYVCGYVRVYFTVGYTFVWFTRLPTRCRLLLRYVHTAHTHTHTLHVYTHTVTFAGLLRLRFTACGYAVPDHTTVVCGYILVYGWILRSFTVYTRGCHGYTTPRWVTHVHTLHHTRSRLRLVIHTLPVTLGWFVHFGWVGYTTFTLQFTLRLRLVTFTFVPGCSVYVYVTLRLLFTLRLHWFGWLLRGLLHVCGYRLHGLGPHTHVWTFTRLLRLLHTRTRLPVYVWLHVYYTFTVYILRTHTHTRTRFYAFTPYGCTHTFGLRVGLVTHVTTLWLRFVPLLVTTLYYTVWLRCCCVGWLLVTVTRLRLVGLRYTRFTWLFTHVWVRFPVTPHLPPHTHVYHTFGYTPHTRLHGLRLRSRLRCLVTTRLVTLVTVGYGWLLFVGLRLRFTVTFTFYVYVGSHTFICYVYTLVGSRLRFGYVWLRLRLRLRLFTVWLHIYRLPRYTDYGLFPFVVPRLVGFYVPTVPGARHTFARLPFPVGLVTHIWLRWLIYTFTLPVYTLPLHGWLPWLHTFPHGLHTHAAFYVYGLRVRFTVTLRLLLGLRTHFTFTRLHTHTFTDTRLVTRLRLGCYVYVYVYVTLRLRLLRLRLRFTHCGCYGCVAVGWLRLLLVARSGFPRSHTHAPRLHTFTLVTFVTVGLRYVYAFTHVGCVHVYGLRLHVTFTVGWIYVDSGYHTLRVTRLRLFTFTVCLRLRWVVGYVYVVGYVCSVGCSYVYVCGWFTLRLRWITVGWFTVYVTLRLRYTYTFGWLLVWIARYRVSVTLRLVTFTLLICVCVGLLRLRLYVWLVGYVYVPGTFTFGSFVRCYGYTRLIHTLLFGWFPFVRLLITLRYVWFTFHVYVYVVHVVIWLLRLRLRCVTFTVVCCCYVWLFYGWFVYDLFTLRLRYVGYVCVARLWLVTFCYVLHVPVCGYAFVWHFVTLQFPRFGYVPRLRVVTITHVHAFGYATVTVVALRLVATHTTLHPFTLVTVHTRSGCLRLVGLLRLHAGYRLHVPVTGYVVTTLLRLHCVTVGCCWVTFPRLRYGWLVVVTFRLFTFTHGLRCVYTVWTFTVVVGYVRWIYVCVYVYTTHVTGWIAFTLRLRYVRSPFTRYGCYVTTTHVWVTFTFVTRLPVYVYVWTLIWFYVTIYGLLHGRYVGTRWLYVYGSVVCCYVLGFVWTLRLPFAVDLRLHTFDLRLRSLLVTFGCCLRLLVDLRVGYTLRYVGCWFGSDVTFPHGYGCGYTLHVVRLPTHAHTRLPGCILRSLHVSPFTVTVYVYGYICTLRLHLLHVVVGWFTLRLRLLVTRSFAVYGYGYVTFTFGLVGAYTHTFTTHVVGYHRLLVTLRVVGLLVTDRLLVPTLVCCRLVVYVYTFTFTLRLIYVYVWFTTLFVTLPRLRLFTVDLRLRLLLRFHVYVTVVTFPDVYVTLLDLHVDLRIYVYTFD